MNAETRQAIQYEARELEDTELLYRAITCEAREEQSLYELELIKRASASGDLRCPACKAMRAPALMYGGERAVVAWLCPDCQPGT